MTWPFSNHVYMYLHDASRCRQDTLQTKDSSLVLLVVPFICLHVLLFLRHVQACHHSQMMATLCFWQYWCHHCALWTSQAKYSRPWTRIQLDGVCKAFPGFFLHRQTTKLRWTYLESRLRSDQSFALWCETVQDDCELPHWSQDTFQQQIVPLSLPHRDFNCGANPWNYCVRVGPCPS